jgi:hypothetical protein
LSEAELKILILVSFALIVMQSCKTPPKQEALATKPVPEQQTITKAQLASDDSDPKFPYGNCKFDRKNESIGWCRFKLGPAPIVCNVSANCESEGEYQLCSSIWNPKEKSYESLVNKPLKSAEWGYEYVLDAKVKIEDYTDYEDYCGGRSYDIQDVRVVSTNKVPGPQCFDYEFTYTYDSATDVKDLARRVGKRLDLNAKCKSTEVCSKAIAQQKSSPVLVLCFNPPDLKVTITGVKPGTGNRFGD